MPSLVTERIESVKAGILGAGAFIIAELTMVVLSEGLVTLNLQLPASLASLPGTSGIFAFVFGAVSGFLFGVTYRYIIREDHNSHLKDGAVLAFGLVRGLALVEQNFVLSSLLLLAVLLCQSIICFAIARAWLDLAMAWKLLKPFVST